VTFICIKHETALKENCAETTTLIQPPIKHLFLIQTNPLA